MLYFLRKARKQLLAENKVTRVFIYMIGEIILVMIGILLAVQVNNWNEERNARKEEQILLKGLKNEMTDNLAQIKDVISYNSRSKAAAGKLLAIYNADHRKLKSETLDSLFAEVQFAWTFNPRLGIVNSIKANSKIGTIQNHVTRGFITSFEEMAKDAEEESLLTRSIIVDRYVLSVSRYISLNDRVRHIGFYTGESKFSSDYAGIFNDREIESLLTYIYIWRDNEIGELTQLRETLMTNLAIVGQDILE
jgi:hypothetical protein